MWVTDHIDDLQADFRVFYRVDDIFAMEGPSFIALAYRVSAYSGVMNIHVSNAQQEEEQGHGGGVVVGAAEAKRRDIHYTDTLPPGF